MNPDKVNLDEMKVAQKPVKVKAFDTCEQVTDKGFKLVGTVSRPEALVLENVLKLHRKEAGTLMPEELQLVASLLALKGKV